MLLHCEREVMVTVVSIRRSEEAVIEIKLRVI